MNRPTKIICGFVVAIVASLSAQCGTLCSGESAATIIDLTVGTRTAVLPEHIRYSTEWVDGATEDSVAVVEVNGEAISSVSGTGFVDWSPRTNATYVLTHKVMNGGEQVGATLTATFLVEGLSPEEPVISPESGTTFENSLTVTMSCPTEGATIYYTTDGSEPTAESTVYNKKFRIYGKTTVKAVAIQDGLLASDMVTAEYALGRCEDPVISLADGTEFAHSNQVVSIEWNNDGVLRYTVDGSEPTVESPEYEEPFSFSDSVVLKAKVFSDNFFDSEVVTSSLTRVWETMATPQIEAAEAFSGSKAKVVISCATEGALIRYTVNGTDPNSHSMKYTGPFYLTEGCTIKAYAVLSDYLNSAVAEKTVEKVWTIGDTMGKPDHGFTTSGSGDKGWTKVEDATAPNGEAMKSGAITHSQVSVLSTTVMGPGTLTFSWRTSCEEDPDDLYEWDHAEFAVDGTGVLKRDGITTWKAESVQITGDGEHTVAWTYIKDDVEFDGEDAAWVAGYGWAPERTETQTTAVAVPYAWLTVNDPDVVDEYESYEFSASSMAANGHKVWECYAVGMDPTDPNEELTITEFEMVDGKPVVSVNHTTDGSGNSLVSRIRLIGKENLSDDKWQIVPEEGDHNFRFFKAVIALP